jgi:hypothetical protein
LETCGAFLVTIQINTKELGWFLKSMFVFWRDVWFPDKVAAELDAKNAIPNFELLLGD